MVSPTRFRHPSVMSHMLPHLSLNTSTRSLSPTSPIFRPSSPSLSCPLELDQETLRDSLRSGGSTRSASPTVVGRITVAVTEVVRIMLTIVVVPHYSLSLCSPFVVSSSSSCFRVRVGVWLCSLRPVSLLLCPAFHCVPCVSLRLIRPVAVCLRSVVSVRFRLSLSVSVSRCGCLCLCPVLRVFPCWWVGGWVEGRRRERGRMKRSRCGGCCVLCAACWCWVLCAALCAVCRVCVCAVCCAVCCLGLCCVLIFTPKTEKPCLILFSV